MKIAIIPARGGSKRIPKKNIKPFHGHPLISYSIKAAINSNIFDEVMVSTDDEEIKSIALRYGASVPLLRSQENSSDFATTSNVIEEVLSYYKKIDKNFTKFCCLYPTAPFLTAKTLQSSEEAFLNSNAKALISICQYSFPIQRSLSIENEYLSFNYKEHENTRSQDLRPNYHDAGQFYWGEVESFLKDKKLFCDHSVGFELSELEVQDIDTLTDWKLAEIKYLCIQEKKDESLNKS